MNQIRTRWLYISIVAVLLDLFRPFIVNAQDNISIAKKSKIPDFVIAVSDSLIVSKTGAPFFHRYVRYDSANSIFSPPDSWCVTHPTNCTKWSRLAHYYIAYTFRIPEKPWVDGKIGFKVDSVGKIITEEPIDGIPDCLTNPSFCIFEIDSSKAVDIAKQDGFEKGIDAWKVHFYWYSGKYVWGISNRLTNLSGKNILIDANTGNILMLLDYETIVN